MFERFRGWWHRLHDANGVVDALPGERRAGRRLTVNRPVELRTDKTGWIAQSVDISVKGILLRSPESVAVGNPVKVILSRMGAIEEIEVLAVVVRSAETETGEYLLGCTFTIEISDTTIDEYVGENSSRVAAEQRGWERLSLHGELQYELASRPKIVQIAELVNLSPAGLGMVLSEKIEPGELLTFSLKRKHGGEVFQILGCIAYLHQRPDERWSAGCSFLRDLTPRELDSLIKS